MLLPVFFALTFGIVMYGAWLAMIHSVQQLAAEAARSSVAGLSESERGALASSYVTANAASYPLIAPAQLSVNAATSPVNSNVFVVTVNYDASDTFIAKLPIFVSAPTLKIVRSAAIPYGGY